ncbi:hypothetical protein [Streptomyces sp. ME19-01-6]|uniref:hypothetical protein n=1 Tax=Streptomyces sp. ME19-01-6 TaxID=3028686 RepID=UPI0029CA712F|nr:hypothetical protein [Streptomyces sp. ME19-01-6]
MTRHERRERRPGPQGAVCVFSAHGVSPQVRSAAVGRQLEVIDAICPLVGAGNYVTCWFGSVTAQRAVSRSEAACWSW